MSDLLDGIVEDFNQVGKDVQTMTFMPRDTDLQRAAIKSAEDFLDRLDAEKQAFLERGDESAANLMLAFQMSLTSVRHELEMWVALKEDRPEEAWDHLVSAQQAAGAALGVRKQVAPSGGRLRL